MKTFLAYLKSKKGSMLFYAFSFLLLILSFTLYQVPLKVVLYPLFLVLLFAFFCFLYGFFKYREKQKKLQKLLNYPIEEMNFVTLNAEENQDNMEKLLLKMQQDYKTLKETDVQKYRDMLDYYTLWVHQIKTPIQATKLMLDNQNFDLALPLSIQLSKIDLYVDMVLAYLRTQSDSTDYVFQKQDIDVLLKKSIRRFSTQFIYKKISLKYIVAPYMLVTDAKWFSFAIEQLLSNALKYTQSGQIEIYVEQEVLHIKDSGIGIRQEDLPRLFENGFTGQNGRMEEKSSGLGLYLVKKIMDNLNLRISISSVLHQGTDVRIALSQYNLKEE